MGRESCEHWGSSWKTIRTAWRWWLLSTRLWVRAPILAAAYWVTGPAQGGPDSFLCAMASLSLRAKEEARSSSSPAGLFSTSMDVSLSICWETDAKKRKKGKMFLMGPTLTWRKGAPGSSKMVNLLLMVGYKLPPKRPAGRGAIGRERQHTCYAP